MKKSVFVFLVFVFLVFVFLGTDFIFTQNKIHEVKLSGNAYVTSFPAGAAVTANGLEKWTDNRSVIQTYIYFSQPQTVKLSIKGSTDGRSTYLVSFQNKKIKVEVQDNFGEIFVGKFKVKHRLLSCNVTRIEKQATNLGRLFRSLYKQMTNIWFTFTIFRIIGQEEDLPFTLIILCLMTRSNGFTMKLPFLKMAKS